jgi:hypothetical protein
MMLLSAFVSAIHCTMVVVEQPVEPVADVLSGLSGVFADAIRHSDLAELGRLAAEYAAGNKTIVDVVGRDIMDFFLNEQDEMKAQVSKLPKIRAKADLIAQLDVMEEWADQVDNGVNLILYGGTEYLFDRLIRGEDDHDTKKAIGRVLVASLQNNEQALALFLSRQLGALSQLSEQLVVNQTTEPVWLISVGSTLIRRTPEVRVDTQVVRGDEEFVQALKLVSGGSGRLAQKAKDLLAFISNKI